MTNSPAQKYNFEYNKYVQSNSEYFPMVDDNYLIDINGEMFFKDINNERYEGLLNEVLNQLNPLTRRASND